MTADNPTPAYEPGRRGRPRVSRQPASPLPEPRDGFIALGVVSRAHGIHGELRVAAFNPGAPNLQRGRRVYLRGDRYTVLRARADRDAWLLQLGGLADRNAAEQFAGQLVEAAEGDVRRNDADSYFIHEIIGLRVITADGRELGTVTEVLQTAANDVYVATFQDRELLIPAIGEVVQAIDPASGILRITPLPGMLDKSQ